MTPLDEFSLSLVKASLIFGSLLDIAHILEVEPVQVWRWLSELDRPPEDVAKNLQNKLDCALRTATMVQRQREGSALAASDNTTI